MAIFCGSTVANWKNPNWSSALLAVRQLLEDMVLPDGLQLHCRQGWNICLCKDQDIGRLVSSQVNGVVSTLAPAAASIAARDGRAYVRRTFFCVSCCHIISPMVLLCESLLNRANFGQSDRRQFCGPPNS
jgi:hypothetical protein